MAASRGLEEGLAFYWAKDTPDEGKKVSMLQKRLLSHSARSLQQHPQGLGNYFTYRQAIPVLGLDPGEIYQEQRTDLPDEYTDMGYMVSHMGPPAAAMEAMREHLTPEVVGPYPPDLTQTLRQEAAQTKFHRPLSNDFQVLGVEGAQGGIGYTFLSFLDPGDEIIIIDPGYMHFAPGPEVEGARVRRITLDESNGFRLDPDRVADAITTKTKMIIVCDPVNPFGTMQSREELAAIAHLAWEHDIVVFNNITHATHQWSDAAAHTPMAALKEEGVPTDHIISTTGMSKGYGLAGIRVGFVAGHPDLLRGMARLKMEVTKIHINLLAQYGALAALRDKAYVEETTELIGRNFAHIEETVAQTDGVKIPARPQAGFCMVLDVADTGVSAQELTVALLKEKVAVIPGDALGDVGTTRYLRLNYSHRELSRMEHFREALPRAIKDAQRRSYADGVCSFYERLGTERGERIRQDILASLS